MRNIDITSASDLRYINENIANNGGVVRSLPPSRPGV